MHTRAPYQPRRRSFCGSQRLARGTIAAAHDDTPPSVSRADAAPAAAFLLRVTSRPYRCRRRRRNGDPHATAARRLCTTRLRSAWVRRISFWRIAGLRHVALLQQRPRLRHGHDPGAGVRPGHLRVGVDHTCVVSCDARAPSTAGTAHCWWSLLENPRGASRRWLLKGSVSLALCLSVAVRYCVYTQGSPCHILPNNINNVVNHLVISDHTAPQLPGQCTLPTCHLRKPEVAASW